MVSINDIVSVPTTTRYAVVVGFIEHGRRNLAVLHYICATTGEKMECPDRERCNHANTCPIHGLNVDANSLEAWNERDVTFYVSEGMLSPELARKALAPTIEIARLTSHKYRVRMAKNGQNIRMLCVTGDNNNDRWQDAIALTNNTEPFGFIKLTNPDTDDYKNFAALFETATV